MTKTTDHKLNNFQIHKKTIQNK